MQHQYIVDPYENGRVVSFVMDGNKVTYHGNTWYFPYVVSPMQAALTILEETSIF